MIKKANKWLYTIEHKVDHLYQFEILFKERYWNEPIKSALRARFEMDEIHSKKGRSRISRRSNFFSKKIRYSIR